MTQPRAPLRLTGNAASQAAGEAVRLHVEADGLAAAGRAAEAEVLYRKALALNPRLAEAHNNLGNVLRTLGRGAEAVDAYHQALACGLDHPLVHYNLGSALRRVGAPADAERAFLRVLSMLPDHAEAFNNLANLLREHDQLEAAATAYRRALALRPDWDEAHDNLAGCLYLLHEDGQAEAAVRAARLWLRDHGDHPVARHIGAAIAGAARELDAGGDARASDAYVRQVFDHFAAEFDRTLADLGYRAPALLEQAIGPAAGLDTVLDAGCGTGLCGAFLRPLARVLVGVDLSAGMLERARGRGHYDRLAEAELGAFLAAHPGAFDLIVAADVLCYFGDLAPVLARAAAALRPGGRLAFTVERIEGTGAEPWRLGPHGRYAHTEEHARAGLERAGLSIVRMTRDTLRQESGEPVEGLVVVATRPAS